ncbi:MAG: DUF5686 family protein [Bacteroidota bacterium]
MKLNCILVFLYLGITGPLFSQATIEGFVTDNQGERLPFVNVLLNDDNRNGVTSDINGVFKITTKSDVKTLTFSYLGFEKLILKSPFPNPLKVQLKPTAYEQPEVIVVAGENPAHRIIRQAVKNRSINAPEKMDTYTCRTYNKMAVGYDLHTDSLEQYYQQKDTTKKYWRNQYLTYQKFHKSFGQQELILVESVTKRSFKKAHNLKEEVIVNRVAGSKKLPLAAIGAEAQPFSFYKDELVILEQPFLNPLSLNSTNKYFFNLTDTLFVQKDTVFIIAFHPRKGKNFEGLEGILYINSNQYAIQNVIAKPTDDHLLQFKINQQYRWTNDQHWFPHQLHFEFVTNPLVKAFAGIKSYGRTYIDEVNFTPIFEKNTFNNGEVIKINEDAYSREDSLWALYRKEELTVKEQNTYHKMDSLGKEIKLDRWVDIIEMISKSRFKMGPVDYDITDAVKLNNYEIVRLGVGLTTNQRLSKRFELGGYWAYGFGDKQKKYGVNVRFLLDKNRDNQLNFYYQNDLFTPTISDLGQNNSVLNYSQFSSIRDAAVTKGVSLQTYPIKYIQFQADFLQQELRPLYDPFLEEAEPQAANNFTELRLKTRFAYNEKFIRVFGSRVTEFARFPIFELVYTKGFDNLWNGAWDYQKYQLAITHAFRRKALGETSYRLEMGYTNNSLPFSKLFSPFGLGRGLQVLSVGQTFQAMDFNEFVADKFLYFFFRHDFGALLFKTKKFQPSIILEHNLALGSLREDTPFRNEFKSLEHGYFEGGLVLENLVRVKYFNLVYLGLGAGAYYRYGANQFDDFRENIALRLNFSVQY